MKKTQKVLAIVLILLLALQVVACAATTGSVIDTSRKGSITIYLLQDKDGSVVTSKGTGEVQTVPEGATPLKDVYFDLYKVGDDVTDTAKPAGSALKSGSTDTNGKLKFDTLDVGRYLVVPTKFPSNVKVEVANFLVDIPSHSADNKSWNYDVIVYPKVQTVYGSVVLTVKDGNNNNAPVPGATFELYKKNEETGKYEKYTNEEYITNTDYTTNSNGQICINNLPDGEYQLVETGVPDGYGLNKTPISFTVDESCDVTGSEEDGWVSTDPDLNLELVNYLVPDSSRFDFNKKLNGAISGGSKIDEKQSWSITSDIPVDIENYTRYLITDQISSKLVLDESSIVVKVDGTAITKNTNYKIYYSNNLLKIAFIDNGVLPTALKGHSKIVIEYKTAFDRTLSNEELMGASITNSADIYYDTKYDADGDDEGEDPTDPKEEPTDPDDPDGPKKKESVEEDASVHTGGLKVKKVNESGAALAGAKFKIATSLENAKAGTFVKVDNVELEYTSGSDGFVYFYGLSYGSAGQDNDVASSKYYLVEIEAPEDYNLLKSPVEVVVNKDSHKNVMATIENKKGLVLPVTGGIGTIIFIVIGVVLMISAFFIFFKRDKDDEEDEEVKAEEKK